MKVCTFIGHRKVENENELKIQLEKLVEKLIASDNVSIFLFGSASRFDSISHEVVCKFKEKYPQIQRIQLRAEYDYVDYKETFTNLEKYYEDTIFPNQVKGAGKNSYVVRNRLLIDKSDIIIFYYNSEYKTNRFIKGKRVFQIEAKSGTASAYEYAIKKKGKRIINMFDIQKN